MKRIKENYVTIILIAIVLVLNVAAFSSYIKNVKSNLSDQTESHINDILDEVVEGVNSKLEEQMNTMQTLALFAATLGEGDDNYQDIRSVFEVQKNKVGLESIEIVKLDGIGKETEKDYSEEGYFKDALKGKTVTSDITSDDKVTHIAFSTPIYYNESEEVSSVLVATIDAKTFYDFIDISAFNKNGKTFVVKKDGTLVSKSEELSAASRISEIFPEKKYEQLLINNMNSKKTGIIEYESDSSKRYIGYSKLQYNKWYVVSILSSNSVKVNIGDMTLDVIVLGIEIGIMIIVLVAYLIYTFIVVKKKSDINLERYFIVSKHSDDIVFDYSCIKNTMYCNENWEENFGYKLPTDNVSEVITEFVFEEDKELFNENVELLTCSKDAVKFECRLLDSDKNPHRCLVKMFAICQKKKIVKVVGVIEKLSMVKND